MRNILNYFTQSTFRNSFGRNNIALNDGNIEAIFLPNFVSEIDRSRFRCLEQIKLRASHQFVFKRSVAQDTTDAKSKIGNTPKVLASYESCCFGLSCIVKHLDEPPLSRLGARIFWTIRSHEGAKQLNSFPSHVGPKFSRGRFVIICMVSSERAFCNKCLIAVVMTILNSI